MLLKDHPRSRGNYYYSNFTPRIKLGSPPLTRELPNSNINSNDITRITPAHAGTTDSGLTIWHNYEDHPRSRGNYSKSFEIIVFNTGSPPLTRELHLKDITRKDFNRITPAHAGTTNLY